MIIVAIGQNARPPIPFLRIVVPPRAGGGQNLTGWPTGSLWLVLPSFCAGITRLMLGWKARPGQDAAIQPKALANSYSLNNKLERGIDRLKAKSRTLKTDWSQRASISRLRWKKNRRIGQR